MESYPDGYDYQMLEKIKQISHENIVLTNKIIKSLTYDEDKILRGKEEIHDNEKEQLVKKAKDRISQRREGFEKGIMRSDISMKELDATLKAQETTFNLFDMKMTVKTWDKIIINYLLAIDYDRIDIAQALGITTKHIKDNIATERTRENLQEIRDIIGRCPECEVHLTDQIEKRVMEYKKNNT